MFPYEKYPYTNFHDLNLGYFLTHFREIFSQWASLYNQMLSWKEATDEELEQWRTTVLDDINAWETALTGTLDQWEAEVMAGLEAWKTAFQTLFDDTFSNLEDIKTAAEAARDAAEAAASTIIGTQRMTDNLVLNAYDSRNNVASAHTSAPFIPVPFIRDGVITGARLNIKTAGVLSFGYVPEDDIIYENAPDLTRYVWAVTYEFQSTGLHVASFEVPFKIPEGCVLAVSRPDDTAQFAYGNYGLPGFITCGRNAYHTVAQSIGINVYKSTDWYENKTDMHDTIAYRGYDPRNSNLATLVDAGPFIPSAKISNCYVKSLRLDARTTGQFSIGWAVKDNIVLGTARDYKDFTVERILTISETGEQTINFDPPIYIPDYAELAVNVLSTDTVTFRYGKNGAEKSAIYTTTTSDIRPYATLNYSIGVDVDILTIDPVSIVSGKKLSIYGDSISTYAGYLPTNNVTFYTGNNCDVNFPADTWWMKTIKALDLDLLVNNSWSGRAVSNVRDGESGHTTDAAYKEANVLALKSGDVLPEIIIVKLGINDFNHLAYLGDYTGESALPSDPSTFSNAYAMMLDLIMTNYPLAKVYCCTLMQCERNGGIGFPEINANGESLTEWNERIKQLANAFGAKVLDHNSCGITYYNLDEYMGDYSTSSRTGLHPNADGHSLIANNTIHNIDNTVRLRF